MLYPCDNYVFSFPVVLRSKAQYEGNGYSLDNCSSTIAPALSYYRPSMDICVVLLPSIHGHIDERWNVAARHHRDAFWVSLSMPTDCVAPLDKGLAIVCKVRLAVNIDKLTEHAIITRIEH